jgi:hypothetical protein
MKKGISILLLILGIWSTSNAQPSIKDSLVYELAIAKHDSNRVLILSDICKYFRNRNTDSSSVYGQQALKLAQQINFSKGEVLARDNLGTTIWLRGDIPDALKLKFKGLQISEKNHFLYGTALCLNGIGVIYGRGLNDQIKALEYYYKAMSFMGILKPNEDASKLKRSINLNIGISYTQINQFDSAQIYLQHAIKASSLSITMHPVTMMFMGELQAISFQKDAGNRAIVLSCVDFSNYWDTTYQYNFKGSLFGGRRHAAFIGANANFFTSPLGHGTGTVSALLNGKSVNFPDLTGLLAGIIRMLEALAGLIMGTRRSRALMTSHL